MSENKEDKPTEPVNENKKVKGKTKEKEKDKDKDPEDQTKPNLSNTQLQNAVNLMGEEISFQEGIIAQTYDQLDSWQNQIGIMKQKIKNALNSSPMKKPRVNPNPPPAQENKK